MGKRSGINLTKTEIQKLMPRSELYRVWDATTRGLGIQVTPSGIYTWVLSYRLKVSGKKDMMVLGRWPGMTVDQSRKAADALRVRIDAGADPKQEQREAKFAANQEAPKVVKVDDLADRYIREHVSGLSASWAAGTQRLITLHILPALGNLPVSGVGPAEVSAMLYELRDTPREAGLTRAVLGTMFQRAEEWGYRTLGSNPVRVVKLRNPVTKRSRRLSDIELKKLGNVMRSSSETEATKVAIRLALMAGMRKGEIQRLRWDQVDIDAERIVLPPDQHKAGHKTGRERVIYLCSGLVNDLKKLAKTKTLGCPYVIPGRPMKGQDSKVNWKPFTALQNVWERLRRAAGFETEGQGRRDHVWIHDQRRTFGSVAADMERYDSAKLLLGHAVQDVTGIYTRPQEDKLRDVAEAIGGRIAGILDGAIDPEQEAEERAAAKAAKKTTA